MAARLAAFDFEATTLTLQSIWDWSRTVQYIIQGLPYSSSLLTSPLLTLWILASSVFDYADRILHCASVHPICDSVTMSSINDKFFHPLLFYFIFLVYKSLLTKWFYCMFRRHYLKIPSWICWYNFVFYNSSVILIVTLLQFVNGCNWDKLASYVTFP